MTTRNSHHYPGVAWERKRKRYRAEIKVLGVPVLLGYYPSENIAYKERGKVRGALIDAGRGDLLTSDTVPGHGRRWETRPQ